MSRPPTLRGERSRPRGGLTLPKSSGSGNEQITSQKAAPQGLKTNIMTKNTHARSHAASNDMGKIDVKFIADEAKLLFDELNQIRNKKQARQWVKSIPDGYERPLFFLIALNRIKNII